METKICKKCGQELEATSDNFSKSNSSKDGFDSRCKRCVNEISRIFRVKMGENYKLQKISSLKEIRLNRLIDGKCGYCDNERITHSNTCCEKHWFKYVSKLHFGNTKKWVYLNDLLKSQNYKCIDTGVVLIPSLNAKFILSECKELGIWVSIDAYRIRKNKLNDKYN